VHTVRDAEPGLVTWSCFDPARIQVVCSTRDGGVSTGRFATLNLGLHVGDEDRAVVENRRRVAETVGAALDDFVFCQQVHDRAVAVVDDTFRGRGSRSAADAVPASDAIVTRAAGLVLAVLVADCAPIVLHDPVTQTLALVHAGWRGTVRGVTSAAVQEMSRLGCDPATVIALIGPAISRDVYQVGDEVVDAARAAFGSTMADAAWHSILRPDRTGRYLFDLPRAARTQLRAAGLRDDNIHESGLATGPDTPFYSHRLEGPTGRFAMCARLLPEATA
jgi:YfiH family protein